MNSHFRPLAALLASISLFSVGGLFGGAMHSFWTSNAALAVARGPESGISVSEWSALEAAVARIEAQLASAQRSVPNERVEVGTPPSPSSDTLAQTVRELQASIDQLRLVVDQAAHTTPDLATLHDLEASLELNPAALAALVDLEAREEGAALREVRFSTPSEILRRFGPPTSVGAGATMYWHYEGHFDAAAEHDLIDIRFVFSQGCVVEVNIAR